MRARARRRDLIWVVALGVVLFLARPADAVVDPPVLQPDLREVDLGAAPANTATVVTLPIVAGDTSFFVIADAPGRDTQVSIDEIVAPGGATLTAAFAGGIQNSGEAAVQWPVLATQGLEVGNYQITVFSPEATTIRAYVKSSDPNAAQTLNVRLWDVTSAAVVDQAAIETAWRAAAVDIFGPFGITIGTFDFVSGDAAARAQHSVIDLPQGGNDSEQRDACRDFNAVTGDERVLHFVLIDRVNDPLDPQGETLGNAAGIPGSPLDAQFDASCVIVSGVTDGNTSLLLTQGVTAWHEAGHFLGLFHTSERDGVTWDNLPDTPQCNFMNDASTSAACPDGSNFMFHDTDMTMMSNDQAFVLKRHPLLVPSNPAPMTCNGLAVTHDMSGLTPDANGLRTLVADGGNNVILGSTSHDVIHALGGNDTVCGLGGNDLIFGGDGVDTIFGGDGLDSIFGGAENDVIRGEGDADTVIVDGGADTVFGGPGGDYLWGGALADTLNGEGDGDFIVGNGGSDVLNGGVGEDVIFAGPGDDMVDGGADKNVLFGEAGNDTIDGGSVVDVIFAGPDNDTVRGNGGGDVLFGEAGVDNITGGSVVDIIFGGPDADTISGLGGNDLLFGEGGIDNIDGGPGGDYIDAGPDNDTINGNTGTDVGIAGTGTDSCASIEFPSSCETTS